MARTIRYRRGVQVRSDITVEEPTRVSWCTFLGFEGMNENLGDDGSGLEPDNSDWGISKEVVQQDDAVKENSRRIGSAAKRKPRRPKGSRDDKPRKRLSTSRKHVKPAALDVQNQAKNHYRPQVTAPCTPSMVFPRTNNTMTPYVPCWGRTAMPTGPAWLPPGMFPMHPRQQSPFFMNTPFFPAVTSNCYPSPLFYANPNTPGERVVIFRNKKDVYVRTENKSKNDKPDFILVDPLCGQIGFGSHQETKIVLQMYYKGDTIIGPIHANSSEVQFVVSGVNWKMYRCQQLHGRYWLQEANGKKDATGTGTHPRVNTIATDKQPTPAPAMTPNAQQSTEPVLLPSITQVYPPVPQNRDSQPTAITNREMDSRRIGLPASLHPPSVLATGPTGAAQPTLVTTTTPATQRTVTQQEGLSDPIANTAPAEHHQHQHDLPNTMTVPWECLSQHTLTLDNEALHSVPDSTKSLAVVPQETATPTVLEIPSPGVVLAKAGKDGRGQIHVRTEQGDCHTPVHPLNGMIGFSSHKQALFAVQNYFSDFRVHATGSQESFAERFELYKHPLINCDDRGACKTFRSVFRHGRFWLEELASKDALPTPEPNGTTPQLNSIVNPPVPQTGQLAVNTLPSWTIQQGPGYVPAPTPPQPSQPKWTCRAPNEYEYNLLRAARRIVLRPLLSVNGRSGFASQGRATSALLRHWNGASFTQSQLPDLGGGSIEYLVLESKNENDNSTKSTCMFRIVKSSGRFWAEEVGFKNRLERDCYREVI